MRAIIELVKHWLTRMKENHISAYSALAAYFIILSAIPFLLILLSLIRFTPLTKEMLLEMFSDVLPSVFYPILKGIVEELYKRATAVLSVSVVLALWSSAKGILAITNGFNLIFGVEESRNYFLLRLRSAGYTVTFILTILVSLVLMVFGKSINNLISEHFPVIASVSQQILDWRIIMALVFQVVIFMFLYRFIPNRKSRIMAQLPGALFVSLGWNIFSYLFSIYVEYGRMSYTYGSLTTLIVVMLWLYFCMYIMFIGAYINVFFEKLPVKPLKLSGKSRNKS